MKVFASYDWGIGVPAFLLLSISLIVLSSLDIELFQSQLIFSILGILMFFIVSSLHIQSLRNLHILFYICSLILLVSLFLVGVEVRGARRWIEFFGVRIQFSELVKPALILAFASLLSRWRGKVSLVNLLTSGALFIPIAFLLLRQPDLGSALIYAVTFVSMLFFGGMGMWYIIVGLLFTTISLPLIWRLLAEYQRNRIITFINPKHDPQGIGYNAIQSAIAVGSGLLLGRGLGRGVQSQLQFLPERHTDFIFATLSEEFGFLGSCVLLTVYFLLFFRILQIARNTDDLFELYTIIGIFMLLLSQTFMNIGMNVGLVPIAGVTLPLLSYGGSSLISTMVLLGIVNAISITKMDKKGTLEIR